MQFIETSQGRFAYLSWGKPSDPPILCLHGFPDEPHSFAPLAQHLIEAGYFVVAPWMRGYFPSVCEGPVTVENLSLDILALSEGFSPEKPILLVGHDWGAVASYVALSEAPSRFQRAVMLAVPHPLAFLQNSSLAQLRRSWYMLFFQTGPLADAVLARDNFALLEKLWRDWSPGYQASSSQMQSLKGCFQKSMPWPVAYYRAMVWPLSKAYARTQNVKPIQTPLLYIHGADDGCISEASSKNQERFFEGPFQKITLANAGHFLQLEQPKAAAEEILRWFSVSREGAR